MTFYLTGMRRNPYSPDYREAQEIAFRRAREQHVLAVLCGPYGRVLKLVPLNAS